MNAPFPDDVVPVHGLRHKRQTPSLTPSRLAANLFFSHSSPMEQRLIPFAKMNGLGNEILVIDMRGRRDALDSATVAALGADPDLPFDQVMSIHDPRNETFDASIEIFNSDGSRAGACGNGMRCVTALLAEKNGKRDVSVPNGLRRSAGLFSPRQTDYGRHGTTALWLARDPAVERAFRHKPDRTSDGNGQSARVLFRLRG